MVADVQCALCRDAIPDPIKPFPRPNCDAACFRGFKPHEQCFRDSLAFKDECPNCRKEDPLNTDLFNAVAVLALPLLAICTALIPDVSIRSIIDPALLDENPLLNVAVKTAILFGTASAGYVVSCITRRCFGK